MQFIRLPSLSECFIYESYKKSGQLIFYLENEAIRPTDNYGQVHIFVTYSNMMSVTQIVSKRPHIL